MTLAIEFIHIIGVAGGRNLTYETKYKVAFGLSLVVFLGLSLILGLTVWKGAMNKKRRFTEERFQVVSSGLKVERPFFTFLHYGHFFLIRSAITLMTLLTPYVNS